jgi:hypothetical protein
MASERSKNARRQYLTPPPITDLMVQLLSAGTTERLLEPCSGAGAFLDALAYARFHSVTAIEIKPNLASHEKVKVLNESFVAFRTADYFRTEGDKGQRYLGLQRDGWSTRCQVRRSSSGLSG